MSSPPRKARRGHRTSFCDLRSTGTPELHIALPWVAYCWHGSITDNRKVFWVPCLSGAALKHQVLWTLVPFLLPTSFHFPMPLLQASPHPSDGETIPHWQVVQDKMVVHCILRGWLGGFLACPYVEEGNQLHPENNTTVKTMLCPDESEQRLPQMLAHMWHIN